LKEDSSFRLAPTAIPFYNIIIQEIDSFKGGKMHTLFVAGLPTLLLGAAAVPLLPAAYRMRESG
jgi:hypothetical protein